MILKTESFGKLQDKCIEEIQYFKDILDTEQKIKIKWLLNFLLKKYFRD